MTAAILPLYQIVVGGRPYGQPIRGASAAEDAAMVLRRLNPTTDVIVRYVSERP